MTKILITGGSGFLGRQLALKLREKNEILLGSRNNFLNQIAQEETGCSVVPLDVSHIESLKDVCNTFVPEIIIHAAATKYVNISEEQPLECIDANVIGSQNVARIAIDHGVKTVIGISSDKASPPATNMYGISKALMEKMFCSLDYSNNTNFSCVRFGNIAWSTGSVFPIWKKMMEKNGIIESTGSNMKRFIFSVDEAANLVIRNIANIELTKGKILSQKMKASKISTILKIWKDLFGTEWTAISQRIGESIEESMIGEKELAFTKEVKIDSIEHFLTSFRESYQNNLKEPFNTESAEEHSENEIINFIKLGM